jgi:biopolymer transport protein ExbB/TolQ
VNAHFQSAISPAQFAERAAARAAAATRQEMTRGLAGLATVAATAPWIGLFGTIENVARALSFGITGPRSAWMPAVAGALSASISMTALGLGVGLASLWCYRYLTGNLEALDREMSNATLEVANQLSLLLG